MSHYEIPQIPPFTVQADLPLGARIAPYLRDDGADVTIARGPVPDALPGEGVDGPAYQVRDRRMLIAVPDGPRFLIEDGRRIAYTAPPGSADNDIVLFLMGSAWAALCYQRGLTPLHTSAVLDDDGGVHAFTGQSGAGKSTLAAALVRRFDRAAVLSLDDLYLTRAARQRLARELHPLFATRGVPGTHDVALGLATLAALTQGEPVALPRFDKATDDRLPASEWPRAPSDCRLLVLEGWCIGARPQANAALASPINTLEAAEDADGRWRHHANTALAGYAPLWDRIDRLAILVPPAFETVLGWRLEQERALRASGVGGAGVMDDDMVARFVMHYERLTRHVLAELPARADLVLHLDEQRRCIRTMRGSNDR